MGASFEVVETHSEVALEVATSRRPLDFLRVVTYNNGMKQFLTWLALRLEKYLPPRPIPKPKPYAPQSEKELVALLRRAPKSVLSKRQREIIAAAMGFDKTSVAEIMLPRSEITFVREDEVLGPLVLDKLYKSGYAHFPVVDRRQHIIGVLHTQALNSLEIKETDQASKFLDSSIYYVRKDYSLEQALAAFLRTNCYFCLVLNREGQVVGLLTFESLVEFLLGGDISDDFTQDSDLGAVMRRQL